MYLCTPLENDKMRKAVFIVSLLFASASVYAQETSYDDYDAKPLVSIVESIHEKLFNLSPSTLGPQVAFEFSIRRVDGEYSMPAIIWLKDDVRYGERSNIALLLDNGDLFELHSAYVGKNGRSLLKGNYFDTCFPLPAEVVEKLLVHPVTAMRINYEGGFFDADIEPGRQYVIRNLIQSLNQCEAKDEVPALHRTLAHKKNDFLHPDLSLSVGTTGLGLDVALPLGDYLQVRTGLNWMPSITHHMSYTVDMDEYGVASDGAEADEPTTYEQAVSLFKEVTGYELSSTVGMTARSKFVNYHLLLDIFPFADGRFHVTTGFYYGNSRIAQVTSNAESAPTFLALGMYNNILNNIIDGNPLATVGNMGVYLPKELEDKLWYHADDVARAKCPGYDDLTPDEQDAMMKYYGRLSAHIGDRVTDGQPYLMVPDEKGMIKMDVMVNRFKPYLGIGYGGSLSKRSDTYRWSVDGGTMFWGGSPSVIMHDGTDLIHDINHVDGRIGDYCNVVNRFKVFPAITFRLSRRLF